MLQQRLLVLMLLLLLRILGLVEASTRPNHLNSISDGGTTSAMGSAATAYDKQPPQQAWQPSAARNNWIILQAATAGGATNHRYDTATQTRSYDARNDFQLQRLPINYYAYNRSAGNYHRPPPAPTSASSSAHVAQPFVLAIGKVRRRPVPLVSAGADTQPQDSTSTFVRHNDRHNNGNNDDGDSAQTRRQDIESRNRNSRNSLNDGNGIDIRDGDEGANSYEAEAELNDILLPLENALDRVRHLCDVVKRILSDVDEDTDDQSYSASSMSNTAAVAALAARKDVPASVSAEGQGRTLQPPHSATTSVGIGRGKKLKKKLKKLLLPLLIAYKLKFLTLIPVLIGGLTLLVGTTGLAGFFFALFTAVMSLKSGGGKSIVVKKI